MSSRLAIFLTFCFLIALIACDHSSTTSAPSPVTSTFVVNTTPSVSISILASTSVPISVNATSASVAARQPQTTVDPPTTTALPTTAVTPSPPIGIRACRAADLAGTFDTNGATGSIQFYLELINTSSTICTLQGPPHIRFVDQRGHTLALDYLTHCFLCSDPDSAWATAIPATATAFAPTATAIAQKVLRDKIGVEPGGRVGVILIWDNWCQSVPESGFRVRLTLPNQLGHLDFSNKATIGGRCENANVQSGLMISQYSRRP